MRTVRIGSGAGYAGDRIEPAIDLMRYGDLDYIIFECLAERTMETGRPLSDIHGEILSANGYIGCAGIVEALSRDADGICTITKLDKSGCLVSVDTVKEQILYFRDLRDRVAA